MAKIKSGFKGERAIVLPAFVVEQISNDVLGKELHITDIGYYPQAEFHYRERTKEEARQFVLIYCVKGNGWFELDGRHEEISEHQFFILPKEKAHKYGSTPKSPWTIYWVHFDGNKASFFANGFDKPTDISPNFNSRIEERLLLFEEIFGILSRGYSMNNIYYAITSFFHFLGSMKFLGEYRESGTSPDKNQNIIDEVIHFMCENIERKLTLADIANHVSLSASHLSALFQKKTGYSPLSYLIHLKIQKACHYLDFTDMKIIQICPKIGIEDPFYFTRIFTKTMGMSPSKYRNQKKG
ncbi:MAG: AraC family transcriptional regulator [Barnesiella sp.]